MEQHGLGRYGRIVCALACAGVISIAADGRGDDIGVQITGDAIQSPLVCILDQPSYSEKSLPNGPGQPEDLQALAAASIIRAQHVIAGNQATANGFNRSAPTAAGGPTSGTDGNPVDPRMAALTTLEKVLVGRVVDTTFTVSTSFPVYELPKAHLLSIFGALASGIAGGATRTPAAAKPVESKDSEKVHEPSFLAIEPKLPIDSVVLSGKLDWVSPPLYSATELAAIASAKLALSRASLATRGDAEKALLDAQQSPAKGIPNQLVYLVTEHSNAGSFRPGEKVEITGTIIAVQASNGSEGDNGQGTYYVTTDIWVFGSARTAGENPGNAVGQAGNTSPGTTAPSATPTGGTDTGTSAPRFIVYLKSGQVIKAEDCVLSGGNYNLTVDGIGLSEPVENVTSVEKVLPAPSTPATAPAPR